MSKTNPRRIPRTQADVDRAYERGREDATDGILDIVVITLKDLGWSDAFIAKFNHKFSKTVQAILDGDIKGREIRGSLKGEYDLEIECK